MSNDAAIGPDNGSTENGICKNDAGIAGGVILDDSVFFRMTCEISELLCSDFQNTALSDRITATIRSDTGLTAVALCRKDGAEFVALSASGSSADSLISMLPAAGDCLAGCLVKAESIEVEQDAGAAKILFTEQYSTPENRDGYGSVWISDLAEYNSRVASTQKLLVNNGEAAEKFKSVAFIPVRAGTVTIGLLLLGDLKKDVFDLNVIDNFEKLAGVIVVAIEQKYAVEAAPGSENSYRELFNDLSEFVIQLDVFGNIKFISENITRYCEIVPEDVRGMNIYAQDLLGVDRNVWAGMIEDVVVQKETFARDILVKTIKGQVAFQLKLVPLWNRDGDIGLIELIFRDVTENKELERVLAEKENLFYNALDSSMSGVVVIDAPSNRMIYVNEVAAGFRKNFTAFSPENESIGGFFQGIRCQDMKGNIFEVSDEAFSRLFQYKKKICKHLRLFNNYNESIVLNLSFTPIENLHGEITSGIIVFINITDIVTVKSQRDEFRDKFSTLFNLIPDTVAISQFSDGKILDVNDSCYKMFGISRVEAVGCTINELGICPSSEVLIDFFRPVKNGGAINDMVVKLRRKSGEEFFATIHAQGVYYSGVYCIISVVHDITEVIRMGEEVKQSEKMSAIGQLVGGVAHDFNNQLTGILGYSDYLVSNLSDPDLKRYAENIATCAVRSADLTEKLLDFSRKGECKREVLDIHEIILEVINMLEHSIDKKITIRKIFNAEVSTCVGDFSQLQNALLNLGINARDAISEDVGMISFITESMNLDDNYCARSKYHIEPGNYISIKVRDTGYGMNAEIISKIFEPFFTTKEPGRGTGMGLAAVWNTIKQHKGAIDVVSSIGRGTTFELLLPEKPGERVTRMIEVEKTGKGKVMLVDDEEIVRIIGEQMLQELGYEVVLCNNGSEAVEVFKESAGDFDFVVLDMIMPKMSGREAFLNLKKIDNGVKVVITSGYARGQEIMDVLSMGAVGVLKKPFYIEDIAGVIADSVEK